jgi:hypothetical protein
LKCKPTGKVEEKCHEQDPRKRKGKMQTRVKKVFGGKGPSRKGTKLKEERTKEKKGDKRKQRRKNKGVKRGERKVE